MEQARKSPPKWFLSSHLESHTAYTLSTDALWPQIIKQSTKALSHLKVCHPEEVNWGGKHNFLIHLPQRSHWFHEKLMFKIWEGILFSKWPPSAPFCFAFPSTETCILNKLINLLSKKLSYAFLGWYACLGIYQQWFISTWVKEAAFALGILFLAHFSYNVKEIYVCGNNIHVLMAEAAPTLSQKGPAHTFS